MEPLDDRPQTSTDAAAGATRDEAVVDGGFPRVEETSHATGDQGQQVAPEESELPWVIRHRKEGWGSGQDRIEREDHPRSATLRDSWLKSSYKEYHQFLMQEGDIADPAETAYEKERDEITWEPGRCDPEDDPIASKLRTTPPGPELAGLIAGLDVTKVKQVILLEMAEATERLIRWAQAKQLATLSEADRRAFLGDVSAASLSSEFSARLSIAPRTAEDRISDATELVQNHPVLVEGMAEGRLALPKAKVIAKETDLAGGHISEKERDQLEGELVDLSARKTNGQLREYARKTLARRVPLKAQEAAHEIAREDREVWLEHQGEGMSKLCALLPAADAIAAYTVIDRAANAPEMLQADDGRTAGHRRADVFSWIMRTMLNVDETPLGRLPEKQRSRPHLMLTVEAPRLRPRPPDPGDTLDDDDDGGDGGGGSPGPGGDHPGSAPGGENSEPGPGLEITLEGYGVITPSAARAAASDAVVSVQLTDPLTGLHRCSIPAPRELTPDLIYSAISAGIDPMDVEVPILEPRGEPRESSTPRPDSEVAEGNIPETTGSPPQTGPVGDMVDWKAIKLAAEWLLESATYRPAAELIRRVLLRDMRCTFPTCRMPAWRCELDHIVPFDPARPAGDQTTEDNLQTVCRRHHQLKTLYGWQVLRDPATGIITWIAPSGARYPSRPEYAEPLL